MKEIYDENLRLRPIQFETDLKYSLTWYSDPEVLYFSEATDTPYELKTLHDMYKYLQNKGEVYIIEILENDHWHPIGDVTLTPDTLPLVIGEKKYRNKGLGRRVVKLIIERARELSYSELKIKNVFTYNLRSKKLFESLGFKVTSIKNDSKNREIWTMNLVL